MTIREENDALRAEVARLREQNSSLTEALLSAIRAIPQPPVQVVEVPVMSAPWVQPYYQTICGDTDMYTATLQPEDGTLWNGSWLI